MRDHYAFDALDEDEEELARIEAETAELPVKGSYCRDCGGIIRVAIMPDAETRVDCARRFREDARDGHEIKIQPKRLAIAPERCACPDPEPKKKRKK